MTATAMTAPAITLIPHALLSPGQYQNRDIFEPALLAELAESIKQVGIRVPIIVRPVAGENRYAIVAGERRWRAAALAGLSDVPCLIEWQMNDADHALVTVIENLQRADLTPIEEARGYATLRDTADLGPLRIAERVGKPLFHVTAALSLLDLPEGTQTLIHAGREIAIDGEPAKQYRLSRSQGIALAKHLPKFGAALVGQMAEIAFQRGTPAAKIASEPLTLLTLVAEEYETVEGRPHADAPAFNLPYNGGPFWQTACQRCPFDKLVGDKKTSWGPHVCLQPAHYLELLTRRQAENDRERDEKIAAIKAKAVEQGVAPDVPTLASFGKVTRIGPGYETPAIACNESCPCRTNAVAEGGVVCAVCTDPARFAQLKVKETKAVNKDRRTDAKERVSLLVKAMDDVAVVPGGYTDREVRLIAEAALSSITSGVKKIEDAGRHILPYLGNGKLFDESASGSYSPQLLRKIGEEKMAAIPTPALVRFAVEALARHDLVMYHEGGTTVGRYAEGYGPPREAAPDTTKATVATVDPVPPASAPVITEQLAKIEAQEAETAAFLASDRPRETFALVDDEPPFSERTDAEIGAVAEYVAEAYAARGRAGAVMLKQNLDPELTVTIFLAANGGGYAFAGDALYLIEKFGAEQEEAPDGEDCGVIGFDGAADIDAFGDVVADTHRFNLLVVPLNGDDVTIYRPGDNPDGPPTTDGPTEEGDDGDVSDQLAALDDLLTTSEGGAAQAAPLVAAALPIAKRLPDPRRAEAFRTLAAKLMEEVEYKDRPADPGVAMTRKRDQELIGRKNESARLRKVALALAALARCWATGLVPEGVSGIKNRKQVEDILLTGGYPPEADTEGRKLAASAGITSAAHWAFAYGILEGLARQGDQDKAS